MDVFVQETTQTVYNWQFIHSLSLWTRLIGELHDDESIQSLIYPLTQTIIGTIRSPPLSPALLFSLTSTDAVCELYTSRSEWFSTYFISIFILPY